MPLKAPTSLDYAISEYVSMKYTIFGWTTHGHTGDDVPLWAWASKDTAPTGYFDNTDMAKIAAEALNVNLDKAQNRLYVNASNVFQTGQLNLDTADPANPVLEISYNGRTASLPISKDTMIITYSNGHTRTHNLEGLTIRAPITSPDQVSSLIKQYKS
jgi:alkaline phosphatase